MLVPMMPATKTRPTSAAAATVKRRRRRSSPVRARRRQCCTPPAELPLHFLLMGPHRIRHLAGMGRPRFGQGTQASLHQPRQPRILAALAQPFEGGLHVARSLPPDFLRSAGIARLPGQDFTKDGAQANTSLLLEIWSSSPRLLGRHVGQGPQHPARLRRMLLGHRTSRLNGAGGGWSGFRLGLPFVVE